MLHLFFLKGNRVQRIRRISGGVRDLSYSYTLQCSHARRARLGTSRLISIASHANDHEVQLLELGRAAIDLPRRVHLGVNARKTARIQISIPSARDDGTSPDERRAQSEHFDALQGLAVRHGQRFFHFLYSRRSRRFHKYTLSTSSVSIRPRVKIKICDNTSDEQPQTVPKMPRFSSTEGDHDIPRCSDGKLPTRRRFPSPLRTGRWRRVQRRRWGVRPRRHRPGRRESLSHRRRGVQ